MSDAPPADESLVDVVERLDIGVVVFDLGWRFRYVNDAGARLAQRPRQQLLGNVVWESFPEVIGTVIESTYRRVMASGQEDSFDVHYGPLDGWFRVRAVPLVDGLAVYFTRVDDEYQRRRVARLHELILNAAGEGIYGLDADGVTTFVNPVAVKTLGYLDSELLGQHQHDLIHHSRLDGTAYPKQECPIHRALARGEMVSSRDDVFWTKDGRPVPVELVATPIVEDGRVAGAVVTFTDITEQLRAEEYRLELERLRAAEAAHVAALHHLQRAMQPPPLDTPSVELGAHYVPALDAPAGGDLYDWLPLTDGSVLVTVVDVMGKGVVAAKDALAVTHALRLLALRGVPLGELILEVDRLLTPTYPDVVATAMVARYEPGIRTLSIATGGHPPPLWLRDGGPPSYVDVAGRAIGWPDAGSDGVTRVELDAGDAVVFYTDGLIEGGRDVLIGMRTFADDADAGKRLNAVALARELVERAVSRASHRDDSLCVVLRALDPGARLTA